MMMAKMVTMMKMVMVIMIMRMMDFKGIALKSLVDRTRRFQALNNQVGDNLKIFFRKVFVIKQRKFSLLMTVTPLATSIIDTAEFKSNKLKDCNPYLL